MDHEFDYCDVNTVVVWYITYCKQKCEHNFNNETAEGSEYKVILHILISFRVMCRADRVVKCRLCLR